MNETIDSMMGFDPQSLDVFQEPVSTTNTSPNIYKTNPKDSKSEDGIYRCKLRVIYDPHNFRKSICEKTEWYLTSSEGTRIINAPIDNKANNRTNPLAQASTKVFLALDGFGERFAVREYPDVNRRATVLNEFNSVPGQSKEAWAHKFKGTVLGQRILEYAKDKFDHSTSTWAIVQILEDDNRPEVVGQYKLMKLPKAIVTRLNAKMHPSVESGEKPVDLMSWVLGYPLKMQVKPGPDDPKHPERKQREISYDLCDFGTDFEPIRKIDNSPLFTDEQIEILDEYATARKDADNAKSQKKKDEAAAKIVKGSDLYNKVAEMTKIAYDYLMNEVDIFNLADEIEYKEWDDDTKAFVQNWVNEALLLNITQAVPVATVTETPTVQVDAQEPGEGLPF